MFIEVLSIVVYDEQGYHWHSEEILSPTWEQTEQGIRDLDRFQRPFIHLQRYADAPADVYLSILGGKGAYAANGTLGGDIHLSYFDDTKSDREIDVWTSDQGYYPEEKYVCYDLNLVLNIARRFAEFGEMSTAVKWR